MHAQGGTFGGGSGESGRQRGERHRLVRPEWMRDDSGRVKRCGMMAMAVGAAVGCAAERYDVCTRRLMVYDLGELQLSRMSIAGDCA